MNWIQAKNGQALVENDIVLGYITNVDHASQETEEWKGRIAIEPEIFNSEMDLMAPSIRRVAPINAKGRVQSLFMSDVLAKETINYYLGLTVKDILLMRIKK